MDNDTQKKLDRLARIEKGNRDRSKRYLDKIKAQGKRQISIILDESTIDELTRRRDQSIQSGTPLTFGDIISGAINTDGNIDENVIKKSVNPISTNTIKNGNIDVKSDGILIKKDVNTVSQDDVKSDGKPNWKTQPAEYRIFIDKILQDYAPGEWQQKADDLNQRGILTPQRGRSWTANNLRMAYNNFKKT